jgi:osmotically-inducible protein OsmY
MAQNASVRGVIAIENEISLTPAAFEVDVQKAISGAFARSARLAADELSVDAPIVGTAVVSGVVSSWTEHDEAVAAAWSAPGVTVVDDRIAVAG